MPGYLINVSYKVLGVNRTAVVGVDKGMLPEPTRIITAFTKYRLGRGEAITNITATVSSRP